MFSLGCLLSCACYPRCVKDCFRSFFLSVSKLRLQTPLGLLISSDLRLLACLYLTLGGFLSGLLRLYPLILRSCLGIRLEGYDHAQGFVGFLLNSYVQGLKNA